LCKNQNIDNIGVIIWKTTGYGTRFQRKTQ
jgi:hypothetical protein